MNLMCGLLLLVLPLHPQGGAVTAVARGDSELFLIDYTAAVREYEGALSTDGRLPAALWRLARVHVLMAEVEAGDRRDQLLRKAEDYARRCIEIDSVVTEGHTWLAGAVGYLALEANVGEQVKYSNELVVEVEKALSLNPADDVAYSVKGSFYRALGNVGWFKKSLASIFLGHVPEGGYPESEAALLQAVHIAPDVMRHQYELGVLYLDMGRMAEARRKLEYAATLPVRIASDIPRLETIRELLSTRFQGNGSAVGGQAGNR